MNIQFSKWHISCPYPGCFDTRTTGFFDEYKHHNKITALTGVQESIYDNFVKK